MVELHKYKATLYEVIDSDTIDVFIDLGFNIFIKERFILVDVDTPKISNVKSILHKQAGIKIKNYLEEKLSNQELIIISHKAISKYKYADYLAEVYLDGHEISINEKLIDLKYAMPFIKTKHQWRLDELQFILDN